MKRREWVPLIGVLLVSLGCAVFVWAKTGDKKVPKECITQCSDMDFLIGRGHTEALQYKNECWCLHEGFGVGVKAQPMSFLAAPRAPQMPSPTHVQRDARKWRM